MSSFLKWLKNPFSLQGTASRKEFWCTQLGLLVASVAFSTIACCYTQIVIIDGGRCSDFLAILWNTLIVLCFYFFVIIAALAVEVRRLHALGIEGRQVLFFESRPLLLVLFFFLLAHTNDAAVPVLSYIFAILFSFLEILITYRYIKTFCLRKTPSPSSSLPHEGPVEPPSAPASCIFF